MDPAGQPTALERRIVLVVAGVQFVNILDFMMVSPLGPRLAESLRIPASDIGLVTGSYTLAASVTGLLGSLYLERFDRKRALVTCLVGLAVGTALGGLATGKATLVLARIVAGAFGGPATSLAFAIVADAIPAKRRGWAMGVVMGGFAVASVLGVPIGLWFAGIGGWRLPFFAVGALIFVAALASSRAIPTLRDHLADGIPRASLGSLFALVKKPMVRLSFFLTTTMMASGFILIPNLPAIVQFNLGFPAARLDLMYLLGGIASFVTTRVGGRFVDRVGATRVAAVGTVLFVGIVVFTFVFGAPSVPLLVVTTVFFVAMGSRMVAYNTLTSRVPEAHERARFQSLQSCVQHAASAIAAFASARLLSEWQGLPTGPAPFSIVPRGTGVGEPASTVAMAVAWATASGRKLLSVDRVAWVTIGLALTIPVTMMLVERALAARKSVPPPPP